MLNPIQAFKDVNSAIQNVTGYSFSLSNIPKNINRIALPAIALATGMYIVASAEDCPKIDILPINIVSKDGENIVLSNYDDCEAYCIIIKPDEKSFDEFARCLRICLAHFLPDTFNKYT